MAVSEAAEAVRSVNVVVVCRCIRRGVNVVARRMRPVSSELRHGGCQSGDDQCEEHNLQKTLNFSLKFEVFQPFTHVFKHFMLIGSNKNWLKCRSASRFICKIHLVLWMFPKNLEKTHFQFIKLVSLLLLLIKSDQGERVWNKNHFCPLKRRNVCKNVWLIIYFLRGWSHLTIHAFFKRRLTCSVWPTIATIFL